MSEILRTISPEAGSTARAVPPKNGAHISGIRPAVLREIRSLAEAYGMRRVVLFGSRARGDFRPKSDVDLAVSGGDADRFRLAVEEETDTLLRFDVVNLDRPLQAGLRESISREGLVIYEKV